jgi:hypothetical protein
MARIRTVKPEFFTSEDIVALSAFARLLYIAVWCECDREGRLNWKPKTFKMRYFPGDELDIHSLCDELTSGGLVKLYGDGLAFVPTFLEHQHINPRETASALPAFDASARVRHASLPVSDVQGGRKERNIQDASLTLFEKFWSVYPKKKNRGDAEKAFKKLNPDNELLQTILDAVEGAAKGTDWLKNDGQFIPYPATWLNAKGWLDGDGGGVPAWER